MRSMNKKCIDNQIASTDRFSGVFITDQTFSCSAQLIVTGNVQGNFKVQSSDDSSDVLPTHWEDVPDSSIAIVNAGTYFIPKTEICSQYHRLVFIDVSSGTNTGTITANFFTQGY